MKFSEANGLWFRSVPPLSCFAKQRNRKSHGFYAVYEKEREKSPEAALPASPAFVPNNP